MTMTAAWNNISKRGLLHSLNGSNSFEEEFTGEIVELAFGAEALRGARWFSEAKTTNR